MLIEKVKKVFFHHLVQFIVLTFFSHWDLFVHRQFLNCILDSKIPEIGKYDHFNIHNKINGDYLLNIFKYILFSIFNFWSCWIVFWSCLMISFWLLIFSSWILGVSSCRISGMLFNWNLIYITLPIYKDNQTAKQTSIEKNTQGIFTFNFHIQRISEIWCKTIYEIQKFFDPLTNFRYFFLKNILAKIIIKQKKKRIK